MSKLGLSTRGEPADCGLGPESRIPILVFLLLLLPGCSGLRYYAHVGWGGFKTLGGSRPIEAMLADSSVPADLRRHLSLVSGIRDFSAEELALPDNASYRRYRELNRPYAVWNVVAAPEFSAEPVEWCFPIAGCVTYRGYFSEERASKFAARLRRRGLDVSVGGVSAFSTLGWFKDPVLSTFVDLPPAELAGLIFHELAHQVAYAKDDTSFNESFATFVEREGVRRWLRISGRLEEMAAWEENQERQEASTELMLIYREHLAQLYASGLGPSDMRERKLAILGALEADYREVWEREPIEAATVEQRPPRFNNADLALLSAYTEFLDAFRALLAECADDLETFYAEARRLANLPARERESELGRLAGTAGSASRPDAGGLLRVPERKEPWSARSVGEVLRGRSGAASSRALPPRVCSTG